MSLDEARYLLSQVLLIINEMQHWIINEVFPAL